MKPICLQCDLFFRPHINGVLFVEGMPVGSRPECPENKEEWKPYKVWVGDVWKCRKCGAEIIVGVSKLPLAEHYQDTMERYIEMAHNQRYRFVQVNDC